MSRRDVLAGLLLALAALGAHAGMALLDGRALAGLLLDVDGFTRLVRIREWWEGAGWADPVSRAFNPPEGLWLHSTRPFDLLVLGPAWLLWRLAAAAPDAALYWTGAAVGPVLHAAIVVAAAWAARGVFRGPVPLLAGAFTAAHPTLLLYAGFGSVEHHGLFVLCGTVSLGLAIRALRGRRSAGHAAGAGVAGGLGLWVSTEAMLFLAPVLGGFALAWLVGRDGAGAARQGARCAAAAALVLAAALALERGPGGLLLVAYDSLALPQVVLVAAAAAVFAALARVRGGLALRAAAGGALGGIVLAVVVWAFPGLPDGSFADADEGARRWLLPFVSELRPLSLESPAAALAAVSTLGVSGVAAPLLVPLLLAQLRGGRRLALLPVLLALALTLAMTVQHNRFAVDLAVPAALIAAAGLPLVTRPLPGFPGAVRLPARLLALSALLAPGMLLAVLSGVAAHREPVALAPAADGRGCEDAGFARWFAARVAASGGPVVVLPDAVVAGPLLAWYARAATVGAPYHRGGGALEDHRAFFDAAGEVEAQDVLARRGVTHVLVCRGLPWEGGGGAFRARLVAGDRPSWLVPEPLPPAMARRFLLLRVVPVA